MEVSLSGQRLFTMKGISLIPIHVKIEPLEIKNNLVKKTKENQEDIQNKLYEGNYFVNILDYTLGEITFAANSICEKWSEHILNYIQHDDSNKKEAQITLTDDAIKKHIQKANPEIFPSIDEIDRFCSKYNVTVEKFVIPAKFNQLEIELEGISARLSSEIFFFRRKLFAELFMQKMDSKIYHCEQNEKAILNPASKKIFKRWKDTQLEEIHKVQRYIKSPFVFDDLEQFSNFKSINEFSPKRELQQDLISETFYWIDGFPKVKNRFERAVTLYNDKSDHIDCVNNLRLTLELLVKEILQNKKSLENQLNEIGKYQKEMGISAEIRNTFVSMLDYFNKYQNNKVKHDVEINNEHEVEFLFGMTMVFIRMLTKPNKDFQGSR
ncbi:hypothetical protein [Flagellimonas nanhaiensis]|nr:hypothetical protein [Allomuricauda nanhaiensis]